MIIYFYESGSRVLTKINLGDITLLSGVPGRTDNGGLGVFLDGVGTVHKCRDWDFVKELLEEHQFSNYNASWLTT